MQMAVSRYYISSEAQFSIEFHLAERYHVVRKIFLRGNLKDTSLVHLRYLEKHIVIILYNSRFILFSLLLSEHLIYS